MSEEPKFEEMEAVADVERIGPLLPYLKSVLGQQESRIEMQVERAMADGALDPQLAVQFWVEKIALRRILRSFEQKVAYGKGVGEEIGSVLNRQDASTG